MKTDQPIYLSLNAGPEAFRVLTGGIGLEGAYSFRSLTVKGLERRLDGICEPDGHDGPVYVLEFQGQAAEAAWYNLLTKMGLYGERHPRRDVQGIGVFLRAAQAPRFPRRISGVDSPVRAVFLDGFLPDWLERESDNPYLAVLAPLVIGDDAELKARAPGLWQQVQDAPIAAEQRDTLTQVMLFWFLERFRDLTAREVWSMLNLLTPIEETRGYQSIKAEGKAEGMAAGMAAGKAEAKAEDLARLLTRRFGPLPEWASARVAKAPLPQLDVWLDGIFDTRTLADLLGPETEPPAH
jgi:hypothetical protein